MSELDRLRGVLRSYSIKRLSERTGISRITLSRIRDGVSSPTFEMHDKIMAVVVADAIVRVEIDTRAKMTGRPRKAAAA